MQAAPRRLLTELRDRAAVGPKHSVSWGDFSADFYNSRRALRSIWTYVITRKGSVTVICWGESASKRHAESLALASLERLAERELDELDRAA